ncbi:ACT domain-containing protein, partial [Pseudomonas mandelii]|uniref:ACT domain-containing protein n=1 Tax=Pseudomonas mandelii TaxID=75612 RepID=UPI003D06B6D2
VGVAHDTGDPVAFGFIEGQAVVVFVHRRAAVIELEHQRGLIALLASSVNAADGNIEKISMDERDGRISVVQLVVSVHDRVHLARVIKKLRALTGVIRITRMRA